MMPVRDAGPHDRVRIDPGGSVAAYDVARRPRASGIYRYDPVAGTAGRRQPGAESLVINSTGRTLEGVSMPFIRWNSRSTSVSPIAATS